MQCLSSNHNSKNFGVIQNFNIGLNDEIHTPNSGKVSLCERNRKTCFQVNKTISAPKVINHLTDSDSDIHLGPNNNHIHHDGFYLRSSRLDCTAI